MVMVAANLASALLANVGDFTDEAPAKAAWALSFKSYFSTATAGAVLVNSGALGTPESSMDANLGGLSAGKPAKVIGEEAGPFDFGAGGLTLDVSVDGGLPVTTLFSFVGPGITATQVVSELILPGAVSSVASESVKIESLTPPPNGSISIVGGSAQAIFGLFDIAGGGTAALVDGISAFWQELVLSPATFFAGATVIVPPPIGSLSGVLPGIFSSNTAGSLSQSTSLNNISTGIHAVNIAGGTATIPPTPTPIPIL